MNHLIFIFVSVLTLIIPPTNPPSPVESGPTTNLTTKVALLKTLPTLTEAPKVELEQVYVPPAPVAPVAAPVSDAPSSCGDNSMANYIYMHESGCSTTITNAEGCVGIGQACPASKLLAVCPNEDYACENQFFTDYANSAYGGWAGAYQHWLNYHWW